MTWTTEGPRRGGPGMSVLGLVLGLGWSATAAAQQPPPPTAAAPPPPGSSTSLPPPASAPGIPPPMAPQGPGPSGAPPAASSPWAPPPIAPSLAPPAGAYGAPPGYGPAPTYDPNATWGTPGQPGWQGYYPPPGGTSFDNPYLAAAPIPREPYHVGMMYGGIAATVGGVLLVVAGSVVLASGRDRVDIYCDGPRLCGHLDDRVMMGFGMSMMIGGGLIGAAGVPLWIIGSRKVVKKTDKGPAAPPARSALPAVRVTGLGGELTWQF